MFRQGHYGVSLLVFAPVGFALVRLGRADLAFAAGASMLWLAMLPDLDHRIPGIPHRGPTHTLAFAGLVGGAFALAARGLETAGFAPVAPESLAGGSVVVFAFLVGFLAVLAHLLADALTPSGVNFLWPLSGYEYTVSAWRSDNRLANCGLFGLGVFAVAGAVLLAVRL